MHSTICECAWVCKISTFVVVSHTHDTVDDRHLCVVGGDVADDDRRRRWRQRCSRRIMIRMQFAIAMKHACQRVVDIRAVCDNDKNTSTYDV